MKKFDISLECPLQCCGEKPKTIGQILFDNIPARNENDLIILSHIETQYTEMSLRKLRVIISNLVSDCSRHGIQYRDTVVLLNFPGCNEMYTALLFLALATRGCRVFLPMFSETAEFANWLELESLGGRGFTPMFTHTMGIRAFLNAFGTTEAQQVFSTLLSNDNIFNQGLLPLGNPLPGVSVGLARSDNGVEGYRMYLRSVFCYKYCIGEDSAQEYFDTGDKVVLTEDNSLLFTGRTNSDFFKDNFGVKIPVPALKEYYQELYNQILHAGYYPMVNFPGLSSILPIDSAGLEHLHKSGKTRRVIHKIQEAVDMAAQEGATAVCLGGYTSILTCNGMSLAELAGCRIITGNTLTAASGLINLRRYLFARRLLKTIFKTVFHPRINKNRRIDAAGMLHHQEGNIGNFFFNKFRNFCCSTPARNNFLLQYVFFRQSLFPEALPEYLKAENHETFLRNHHMISFESSRMENFISRVRPLQFNKIQLSNIGDWMSKDTIVLMFSQIQEKTQPGCRMVMQHIYFEHPVPESASLLKPEHGLGDKLIKTDRFPFSFVVPIQHIKHE